MTTFFQKGPELRNQFDDDRALNNYLKRVMPPEILKEITPGLKKLGQTAIEEVWTLGNQAEAQPPRHVPFDSWGRRIDHIEVSQAWKTLEKIAAEEQLISVAYERPNGIYSRIHQFARVYLFSASSAVYICPLAMTDGAARAIELFGDDDLKKRIFKNLTSSDPQKFWTSGQWMTERTGGSDVATTTTVAKKEGAGFRLYGDKWFTSATTSQVAMTLARIEDQNGRSVEGGKGLSLFCLELRNPDGSLKNITINRLKDKLGTRALPTAELTLNGTPAILVGGEGDGIKKISALFNITRIWNSCAAVAFMRRGLALARSYAHHRVAFGKKLIDLPLHQQTLAALEAGFQLCFHLCFRVVELLGKEELNQISKEESILLRVLTPLLKLYTAKEAIHSASEVLECFGGAGYVEDTGLPRLLRDSQVLSIWEGTTNVLSLDMLRAHKKEEALFVLFDEMTRQLKTMTHPELLEQAAALAGYRDGLHDFVTELQSDSLIQEYASREVALKATRLYGTVLLGAQAQWELNINKSTGQNPVHVLHALNFSIKKLLNQPNLQIQELESLAR